MIPFEDADLNIITKLAVARDELVNIPARSSHLTFKEEFVAVEK